MWTTLKQRLFPWRANRSKERRGEKRHRVAYQGKLLVEGETLLVDLEDASLGGTRLRSIRKLRAGQAVVVTFPCGAREAICRWSLAQGECWVSGLQFVVSP